MKVRTAKETDELGFRFRRGFFDTTLHLRRYLEELEIGGSLEINETEWPYKSLPGSQLLNQFYKKSEQEYRFRIRRMNDGKQFVIIRLA